MILAGSRTDDPSAGGLRVELDRYQAGGGRVAVIGQDLLGTDTVAVANRSGAAALAEALRAMGHREFAILAGPPRLITAVDRCEGFAGALAGLSPQIVHGPFDRDGGSPPPCRSTTG